MCGALVGCGSETEVSAGKARSDVVTGAPGAQKSADAKPAGSTPSPHPTATGPRRKLCDKKPASAGKKPASVKFGHVEAEGETPLGDTLPSGGAVTWVNLWAGWCGPCKQEIPLLKGWETKLGGKLKVEFLSVDDDERQAVRFLAEQPASGVKKSFHLKSGEERKEWLTSVGIEEIEKLPMHVLLDKSGAVLCVAAGAVEEADFPEVEALVSR